MSFVGMVGQVEGRNEAVKDGGSLPLTQDHRIMRNS
jgi:hypothetical protein